MGVFFVNFNFTNGSPFRGLGGLNYARGKKHRFRGLRQYRCL
jgi:hypothetical protein